MLRRVAAFLLLTAAFAAPARADATTTLLPGVTLSPGVQFTPHGPVAIRVITAPRPGSANGLYGFGPVLGRGTIVGGRERVTQIQQDVSAQATVAGVNGDLFNFDDSHPSGMFMNGGVLFHPPLSGRSSIGVDAAGSLLVDRVRFFGTWKGTGQRRPLNGLNETPVNGGVALFTPQYGTATPRVANAAEVVLQPFPAAVPNIDLAANVTATATGGGTAVPPDGAVLMATGASAAKLQAEAPVGTPLATRLILQPAWTGVVDALGGGPVLVRNGAPVFRSLEDFTSDQITHRDPRAGVGQLSDGRIVLVAVDGRQPGYSVGMTSFELAQTLVRLGAVTGSAVDSGGSVTVAFDGKLLNRPSDPGGERQVKEALLVKYYGVYAPPPPIPVVNRDPRTSAEPLSFKLVRPSTVTANVIGPDRVSRPIVTGPRDPGTFASTYADFDQEGIWRWNVTATDDLGRTSTIDRFFRFDTTLGALRVPRVSKGGVTVRFSLARAARATLRIETRSGVIVRTQRPVPIDAGAGRSLRWDGRLPKGTRAYGGIYVAHVFVTSLVGKMDLAASFTLRR